MHGTNSPPERAQVPKRLQCCKMCFWTKTERLSSQAKSGLGRPSQSNLRRYLKTAKRREREKPTAVKRLPSHPTDITPPGTILYTIQRYYFYLRSRIFFTRGQVTQRFPLKSKIASGLYNPSSNE